MSSGATSFKRYVSGSSVVEADGSCSIPFLPPAAGMWYTGTIVVYNSPSNAVWNIVINGVYTDLIAGGCSTGGIQIGPGDELSIVAMNLIGFVGQTMNATYNVIESPENDTELVIPGHDTFFLPGTGPADNMVVNDLPFGKPLNYIFPIGGFLRSIFIVYSATANEVCFFQILDAAGNTVWQMITLGTFGPGDCTFQFAPGVPIFDSGASASLRLQMFPLPADLAVSPGWSIQSLIVFEQPGDQFVEVSIVIG